MKQVLIPKDKVIREVLIIEKEINFENQENLMLIEVNDQEKRLQCCIKAPIHVKIL